MPKIFSISTTPRKFTNKILRNKKARNCCVNPNVTSRGNHKPSLKIQETTDDMVLKKIKSDIEQEANNTKRFQNSTVKTEEEFFEEHGFYGYWQIGNEIVRASHLPRY